MKEKTTLIQFKFTLAIVILVSSVCVCAGVAYAGYGNTEKGFAGSDIAKCLYFLMVGMTIVIVRRLKKKKNHVENKVSIH